MSSPRIIGGKAKGIRLKHVPGYITRPITDMVKQALFNILSTDVQGSRFLDLFGGTGSVGIEALSRGAEFACFVDLNRAAINTIRSNVDKTGFTGHSEITQADALKYLKNNLVQPFEYIFIAPPQYKNLWSLSLQALDSNSTWLSPDGWAIVQIDVLEYHSMELTDLIEFDQRRYGDTLLLFFEHRPEVNSQTI